MFPVVLFNKISLFSKDFTTFIISIFSSFVKVIAEPLFDVSFLQDSYLSLY